MRTGKQTRRLPAVAHAYLYCKPCDTRAACAADDADEDEDADEDATRTLLPPHVSDDADEDEDEEEDEVGG